MLTPIRIVALLCHYYPSLHPSQFRGQLSTKQIAGLLQNIPYLRYQRDEAALRYHFAKMDEKQRKQLVEDYERLQSDIKASRKRPQSEESKLFQRAWAVFALAPYGLMDEEELGILRDGTDLGISAEAAGGILSDVGAGLISPTAWRELYGSGKYRTLKALDKGV